MGTAILSPQDCLVPPHGRHNHRFGDMMQHSSPTSPQSRRAALQAAVVQSETRYIAADFERSTASRSACDYLAEIGVTHRLNDSPGLLPVPVSRVGTRHASITRTSCASAPIVNKHTTSNTSSRTRQPAGSPAASSPCSHRASSIVPSSSNSKSSFSRSASAGLLAFRGSQKSAVVELGHESLTPTDGGLLSKVAKNNRMVDRAVDKFEAGLFPVRCRIAQTSKFLDAEKGSHEKRITVGDLRKRTRADFVCQQAWRDRDGLAVSRNGLTEGGSGLNGPQRLNEGKELGKRRETDREFPVNEVGGNDAGKSPVITILQRPKDKDAAVELIARFFKQVESISTGKNSLDAKTSVEENQGDGQPLSNGKAFPGSNEGMEMNVLKKASRSDSSNRFLALDKSSVVSERLDGCEDRLTQTRDSFTGAVLPRQGSMDSQMASRNHHVEIIDASRLDNNIDDTGVGEISKYIASIFGEDKWLPMFCNERWAGPAFTNSPPPSSLPLPKFPVKQIKSIYTRDSYAGNQSVADSFQTPEAPFVSVLPYTRRSVSLNYRSPINVQKGPCDIAFATKDLRRLLNLDAC